MRCVVYDRYGPPDVLRLEDRAAPVPGDDDLLVRVRATTVNRTDCAFRAAKPAVNRPFSGLLRPRRSILGTEFAGEVERVGAAVTGFAPGDRVFGVNATHFGAHAEFLRVAQTAPVATMPAGVSFEQAAAVCDGAIIAMSCLRTARLQAGQRILVYGASGSIGTAAVQLAKDAGAEVTAVCDTRRVDTLRSLGADTVLDYTREDFAAGGAIYDVVFDAVGKTTFRRCRPIIKPGGVMIETDLGARWQNIWLAALTWRLASRRVVMPIPRYTQANVLALKHLVAAGRYRAVIDRTYPLEQVIEATRYVETEQKTGNVVLTIDPR
ncbi:MAG TPA: NAD(P)-dependent alcohol dehydrogenase [Solirubrobacter sp.]|nr:NAD(P)-dependent alcohol dehydrogenase [Solirubrobacter sp.]